MRLKEIFRAPVADAPSVSLTASSQGEGAERSEADEVSAPETAQQPARLTAAGGDIFGGAPFNAAEFSVKGIFRACGRGLLCPQRQSSQNAAKTYGFGFPNKPACNLLAARRSSRTLHRSYRASSAVQQNGFASAPRRRALW